MTVAPLDHQIAQLQSTQAERRQAGDAAAQQCAQQQTALEQLTAQRSQLTAQAAQHQQQLNALIEALAAQRQRQQVLEAQTPLAPLRQRLSAPGGSAPDAPAVIYARFSLPSDPRASGPATGGARRAANAARRAATPAGERASAIQTAHAQLQEVERIHELEKRIVSLEASAPCCRAAHPARCAAPPSHPAVEQYQAVQPSATEQRLVEMRTLAEKLQTRGTELRTRCEGLQEQQQRQQQAIAQDEQQLAAQQQQWQQLSAPLAFDFTPAEGEQLSAR